MRCYWTKGESNHACPSFMASPRNRPIVRCERSKGWTLLYVVIPCRLLRLRCGSNIKRLNHIHAQKAKKNRRKSGKRWRGKVQMSYRCVYRLLDKMLSAAVDPSFCFRYLRVPQHTWRAIRRRWENTSLKEVWYDWWFNVLRCARETRLKSRSWLFYCLSERSWEKLELSFD